MAFQTPLTIQKIIHELIERRYVLPAIQREFVWRPDQITALFDSILKGYPISSFLFWRVQKQNVGDYQFYEFLRDYHERDRRHNPTASVTGQEDLTAVLDGQQRLTALSIGLLGTDARKRKHGRWDDPSAFPAKKLHLNLLTTPGGEFGEDYEFRLLTPGEAANAQTGHWFRVGEILNMEDPLDKQNYLIEHDLAQDRSATKILFNLGDAIWTKASINYYLEGAQDLHKVLTIFIRLNSGGTPLSYADLLLSVATAQWKSLDARQEIGKLVDRLNQRLATRGIQFDNKFVLKACLVLADIPDVGFVVSNFKKPNVETVENRWENICAAMELAARLILRLGFNSQTLTSKNAVIPIAYYLLKLGCPSNYPDSVSFQDDREAVKKWLVTALLRGTFSGQADTVLSNVRAAIAESALTTFPADQIAARLDTISKNMKFNDEEIARLSRTMYGSKESFLLLSLLYPMFDFTNNWHKDHIFPQKMFTTKGLAELGVPLAEQWRWRDQGDTLSNLQLLEGTPNQEKSAMPPQEWLSKVCATEHQRVAYLERHFMPAHGFDPREFLDFASEREQIILDRLRVLLGASPIAAD